MNRISNLRGRAIMRMGQAAPRESGNPTASKAMLPLPFVAAIRLVLRGPNSVSPTIGLKVLRDSGRARHRAGSGELLLIQVGGF
jgi:hypothetical protein